MTERTLNLMDIREVLVHIRAGSKDRQIERDTGIDRRTVKRYREWAKEQGFLEGALPDIVVLQRRLAESYAEKLPPQNTSSLEAYRQQVEQWLKENVEAAAIHARLRERGYRGSYDAVWRYVRKLKPRGPEVVVRVESKPGEEAQVDFGYAGMMLDPASGQVRKSWAFVMVLSWSRHMYVEFVWDQSVGTWLRCHRNAFAFFGGVPERVVVDNLKAAIVKAIWDDPQVQYSYRECAQHYGFLIAPCRPATPQHKGKVEQGGVHYVCRNFLGGRQPTRLSQANQDVLEWCHTTAGLRIHGTTKEKPLERFEQVEKGRLKVLPDTPYDLAIWKKVKVHRDCYVVFDNAFYSVPYRLYPGQVWVCGGAQQVRIFNLKYELIATHERAQKAGERKTVQDHLPPEKIPALIMDQDVVRVEAEAAGPAVLQVVQAMLDDPVRYRLPTARKLVLLRKRYADERLDAACRRALAFEDGSYRTIRRILEHKLDQDETPFPVTLPPATTFARQSGELVGCLAEVERWN